MPHLTLFRSGSFSCPRSGSRARAFARRIAPALILVSATPAFALTVNPILPWAAISPFQGSTTSATVYYSASGVAPGNPAAPRIDTLAGFRDFDFARNNQSNDPSGISAIYFDLTSSIAAPDATHKLIITAYALTTAAGGNTYATIPISWEGTPNAVQPCISNGGSCNSQISPAQLGSYAVSVQFLSGQTNRIGVYPFDICAAAALSGVTAQGCTGAGGGYVAPTTTHPTTFTLKFFIKQIDKTDTTTFNLVADSPADENAQINFVLQDDKPTYNTSTGVCNILSTDSGIYFPGDSEITLQPDLLKNAWEPPVTGTADIDHLVVLGRDGGAPNTVDYFANISTGIFAEVPFGQGGQHIGGFVNSTSLNNPTTPNHPYTLYFAARNAAGVFGDVQLPQCQLTNVGTAAVGGFLNKSKCFIATASFRSPDAAPVMMLREFRDRILLHSIPGRAFVQWYYGWSPGAARWLLENPAFRIPVLWALVPIQILAWFCLHPLILALLLLPGACLLFALRGDSRVW